MAANEQQQKEQQDLREPAHHARRPMNAFLIFCKRHRGSVRSGFPHLENRAVTRVLGEWWATLHPDQKRSYTNLAQEYKDAFLNANPDFKWYKLPAPPLRTLTTRPTNKKSELGASEPGDQQEDLKFEFESSERISSEKKDGQAIQPGKLADESQIGGLSSLFTPQKTQSQNDLLTTSNDITNSENNSGGVPKPPKKRYIELPLDFDQKRECKIDLFGDKKKKRSESNNNLQDHLSTVDDGNGNYFEGNNASFEENNLRGERTCKGLRYQKFLAEQLKSIAPIGHQTKRKRGLGLQSTEECSNERRNSISSNVSEKTDSVSSEGGNSSRGDLEHLVESAEGKVEASKPEETETAGTETQPDYGPWTARKRFKAEDFNLDKKIQALPSLSLEEFQEKKKQQRTKKKKIVQKSNSNGMSSGIGVSRRHHSDSSSSSQSKSSFQSVSESQEEAERALLVGSQKRKARKQSITRNAAATSVVVKRQDDEEPNKDWCASPGLEALACLAAVAANRTKLTK
ncbi:transcription factor Sox-11 isoform X2 [Cephus cinctus]|uniref:Transcription factor Sox-11 isoform X2 n=1 Tax=Cephus cinctus TaxID=211228 RepID=A0AAJ7FEA8_CEPCN|nr:transcription factor Sox-11 isoform X2 [Cephus cinctus]